MLLYYNLLVVAVSSSIIFLPVVPSCAAFVAPSRTVHHPLHHSSVGIALPVHNRDIRTSFDGNFRNEQRVLTTNKPRLASTIEVIMKWFIKYILLSKCSSLTVYMNAASNRDILKGNINKLSVSARNCIFRFKLLSFRRLDVNGQNLQLGYLPLLLPMLPFFLWSVRRYIRRAIITIFLLQITGYFDSDYVSKQIGSVKRRLHRFVGSPRPANVNYSMAIASSDIENSLLLRFWLRNILQSLVQNSVVGAVAALEDAAQQSIEAEGRRMRNKTPLLPGSVAASNIPSQQDQQQQQQQGLTSALLSATSFELKSVGFMDERVVFDAKAVLPKDENGVSSSLQFCIRAKLAPTMVLETGNDTQQLQQQQDSQEICNALGFISPECRLTTNPVYAPILLLKNLIPNLIPEYLWLPFGMGVAVPLGKNCQVYRADVTDANDDSGYVCKIDGSVNVAKL